MQPGDFIGGEALPEATAASVSSAVCGAEYRLDAPEISDEIIKRITITPPPNPMQKISAEAAPVSFGYVDGTQLVVPRFFGLQEFGPPTMDALSDGHPMGVQCKFCGVLSDRTRQADVCEAVYEGWDSNDPRRHGARVTLPCGFGKTVVAIRCIARAGRRALIVVPNSVLASQWRERLAQFLPDARVEELRGGMSAQRSADWVTGSVSVAEASDLLRQRERTVRVSAKDAAQGRKVSVRSELLHVEVSGDHGTVDGVSNCSFTVRGDGSAPVTVKLQERLPKPPARVEASSDQTLVQYTKPVRGSALPVALGAIPARLVCGDSPDAPDVVIATVQTMAMVALPLAVLQTFGTVVVDEVHSMCARVFNLAMRRVPARRMLSLSATPTRRDGMHVALPWLCGVEVARLSRTWEHVDIRIVTYISPAARAITTPDGTVMLARMITQLCTDAKRTALIARKVDELHRMGRCVLVLTERVEHMIALQEAISQCTGETVGRLCGSTPQTEREGAVARRVLVATYPMCRQGFDKAELDTLVMATPVTAIEQCVGRILRPHPTKQTPLVVDVVDPYSIFMG